MNIGSFLKANKVGILYSYTEGKNVDGSVHFGWMVGEEVPLDEVFVISTPSRSKKFSEIDLKRAKEHGSNLTTLSDYRKFFKSFTTYSPEDFLKKYSSIDRESLSSDWNGINKNAVRDDEAEFYLNLARLIVEEKKFSMYGRIFKIHRIGP